MKRFLSKTIFLILLAVMVLVSYYLLRLWLLKPLNPDAVYVWGDSQTYQGIQIDLLSKNISCPICSAAEHGNGVYDFLVFTENIPDSSICLIGFSEACLLRKISSDNNHSGVNIPSMVALYESGYPLSEIVNIFTLNRGIPKRQFSESHYMYSYSDTISLPESVEDWCNMFETEDIYHYYKQRAYLSGIEKLHQKGCELIVISFPIYYVVEECASNSLNRIKTNALKEKILELYDMEEKNFYLDSDSLLMHDLSHLNEIGARKATQMIVDSIQFGERDYFVSIRIPAPKKNL
ncbi:MAG: hypothetical protein II970_03095 [Paludibacteraceae bacterium]|nr:hypothetical protein [Paludibacteraceae bacterium]